MKDKFSVRDMTFIALMAVVIAVCSWISLRIGTVPLTLQTFGVAAALCMLGGRRGTFSVIIYILLGLVGVPVFANFTGGAGALFGMTGGYIIGFLLMGAAYWLITSKFGTKAVVVAIALAVGLILCYAFGTAWFMVVYSRNKGDISLLSALSMCVFPFIIPDAVKLTLAAVIAKKIPASVKEKAGFAS
ncbi:MAG: biotin transporter BioY [Oscillospiraceae bacterium]|nr:biotin transporter BioY [Oscillospiraceae bacterium]